MESLIFPAKSVKSLFDRLENESRNHSVESSGGEIIELSKNDNKIKSCFFEIPCNWN